MAQQETTKNVGEQIVLDNGQVLSTGFTNVAMEDSSTLLDNGINMIDEVSCAQEGDDSSLDEDLLNVCSGYRQGGCK